MPTHWRKWTDEETQILKQYGSTETVWELLKRFEKRHPASIYHHLKILGIKPPPYRKLPAIGESKARSMTEAQKAWLASAVDGEGSICIWRFKGRGTSGKWFHARIQVANNSREYCEFAKAITGCGGIGMHHYSKTHPEKVSYRWVVWRKADVLSIILQIRPYLIIKGEQADIVEEFCQMKSVVYDRLEDFYRRSCAASRQNGKSREVMIHPK